MADRTDLEKLIDHLDVALGQSLPKDDEIIMQHVRDAHLIACQMREGIERAKQDKLDDLYQKAVLRQEGAEHNCDLIREPIMRENFVGQAHAYRMMADDIKFAGGMPRADRRAERDAAPVPEAAE